MNEKWRIQELAGIVAQALRMAGYVGPASARVRAMPDTRTIRYYTTLGLLDRPAEMRGRTAYYGRRHVLQLVAIKKLQARGASLLDVQRALAGVDDETLIRLAGLPDDFWESIARSDVTQAETTSGGGTVAKLSAVVRQEFAAESKEAAAKVDPRALPFWQVVPSRMPSASDEFQIAAAPSVPSRQAKSVQAAAHLKVAPGVTLVLEGVRPEQLTPDVLCEVQPAVRALLRSLQRHDVIPLQSDGEDS